VTAAAPSSTLFVRPLSHYRYCPFCRSRAARRVAVLQSSSGEDKTTHKSQKKKTSTVESLKLPAVFLCPDDKLLRRHPAPTRNTTFQQAGKIEQPQTDKANVQQCPDDVRIALVKELNLMLTTAQAIENIR